MANAWLDSLSEDWVSQPRSDDISQAELPSIPSPRADHDSKDAREHVSRIPRFNAGNPGAKKLQQSTHDSSINVLSERSMNDVNIRSSQRHPSKLSREIKGSQRGRHPSRSVSASTTASVVHNTIQHNKSQSASPSKLREDEPEWKRRLLYGELNYGETKDLFSSAGTGLENIFRPPPTAPEPPADEGSENEGYTINETTLPSSPPPYSRTRHRFTQEEETLEQSANESSIQPTAPPPKQMTFRRTGDDSEELSRGDESAMDSSRDDQGTGTNTASLSPVNLLSVKQPLAASRKISGLSDVRNEDLSPILISRHDTEDGKMSFAPVDLPTQQLRKRLEQLRRTQLLLDPTPNSNIGYDNAVPSDGSQRADTTEDYATNGSYLNLQRGGRSAEGSFRQRPLSPPLNTDTSQLFPESSLQASTPKQFPTFRTDPFASDDRKEAPAASALSPVLPRAPHPSPEKRLQPPANHSGSPLKLFGPYDTFTNQTLLRRISQFEDQATNSPSRSVNDDSGASPTRESPSEPNVFMGESDPRVTRVSHGRHETFATFNQFGAGALDGYEFNEDISLGTSDTSQFEDKENMTPAETRMPISDPVRFAIHEDLPSDAESLLIQRRRHKSSTSASSRHSLPRPRTFNGARPKSATQMTVPSIAVHLTPKRDGSEGKRPRTSPSKDPTPKRRRTLHRSDIAYGLEERPAAIETVQSSHYNMQSAIGRKRKDVQGDLQQAAHAGIVEMRQSLRPRSPTPSQRSSVTRERYPLGELAFTADDERSVLSPQGHSSETSARGFAVDGSRKTSMKTQDFFDAAEEIMAMIRSKARPRNDLGSVEESEVESAEQRSSNTSGGMEDSYQESTREPFSRPPSREGHPLPRLPTRQEDPELADRLKMYEDRSDLGEIITDSLRSIRQVKNAVDEANSVTESIHQSLRSSELRHSSPAQQEIISDLSNVRISRNPDLPETGDDAADFPSDGSRFSGNSTGRSIPTASSGGSDSRRLIAPHAVTQLIGDQVGNMVFDKEKNMWLKVKPPKPTSRARNIVPSEDSEDDPFASIPDLSVDTIKEIQNLGLVTDQNLQDLEDYLKEKASTSRSPTKAPTAVDESLDDNSIMSHTKEAFTRIKQTLAETAVEDDEEIEHEITIHQDRMLKSSPSRRRNLTISFSSPIASIIQDVAHRGSDDDNIDRETTLLDQSVSQIASDSLKRGRPSKSPRSVSSTTTKSKSRSRSRGLPRNLSVKGQAFVPRPVSRIDERDEEISGENNTSGQQHQISILGESSIVGPETEDNRNTSLSFVVTTPAPARTQRPSATPVIGQYVGTLSLSPLSDFTMNHADQSRGLEVSYVVGEDYLVTGDGSQKIMSQAIRSLVEKITEVEPFEPDWESMHELDINGKQLTTLHMLNEFCTSVVTLDASRNSIDHLDGVPQSVRNLRMTHNRLSELTAWGHLTNLQYVDVSNNQINSLYAFKDLVHLRSLRADNNQITSLDGIKFHDSLQVLRARNNAIEEVDFDGTNLHRLTELDLESNQIASIQNIDQLACLSTLNLRHNRLSSFSHTTDFSMPYLKYLTLSDNDLVTLNISAFPSLRLLHVDRNQLTTITGFSRCRRLDSLSLREQRGDTALDTSFLNSAYEVRKLFLSGNLLSAFNPRVDFLNLQYLELANCGLQSLPPELGQLMPNLRVLNLNFNAIEDLSSLRYIPRLKKLLVAGNRLSDAGQVADVLAGFPHLSRLDFRDNPAALGFYPPVQTLVPTERTGKEGEFDPFVLPDVDADRDEKFTSRLDMGTRMRKRLYEMVVLDRCKRLKMLDGLLAPRDAVRKSDCVWTALVASGIVGGDPGACGESGSESSQ